MRPFAPLLVALLLLPLSLRAHDKEVEGPSIGGAEPQPEALCEGGTAEIYPCENVDLLAWLPPAVFNQQFGNDIWGFTDPLSGREYALMGFQAGTAFVEITDPRNPVHVGLLPTETVASSWRDIKTSGGFAFIVSEAADHGMQIFDLGQLSRVTDPPVLFTSTAHYGEFGNAHNVAVDPETGIAFAVGTDTCAGGLHMVDVTRPREPVFAGCFDADGYTHDAQCVVYRGPDAEHANREVCINSNEDTLTIVDVTSKDAPRQLSRMEYAGRGYTHQGWLTEDQRYFLLDDELDERRNGHATRTYVWDVSDLDAPFVTGSYTGPRRTIDHNQYVRGNHVFQANYASGLRVLRLGDLSRPELAEVASFDTFPGLDGFRFSGAWGVYPFFKSGVVIVSDINRGLFVLRVDLGAVPECDDGIDNDGDGLVDHPADPGCAEHHSASEAPSNPVTIAAEPGRDGSLRVLQRSPWYRALRRYLRQRSRDLSR